MEQEVRLIDANKLKNHYAWWEGGSREMTMDEAKRDFDTIIDVQPTVDAVEVVRCKNCKHFNADGKGWHWCYLDGRGINEDSYCSSGERKNDAEEE